MKANTMVSCNFFIKGIQVNVVSPSPTDTPAFRKLKGKSVTVQRVMWEKRIECYTNELTSST